MTITPSKSIGLKISTYGSNGPVLMLLHNVRIWLPIQPQGESMKTIAIGLTLLLMGNMSFAQKAKEVSHKKLMQKIERETVRPSQKAKPLSVQFMNEINRKAIIGEKRRGARQGAAYYGMLASVGCILASSVYGPIFILPAVGTGAASVFQFDFLHHAVDQSDKYPEIQKALAADMLKRFAVVLVSPSQITNDIKKELIQFLSHPRRDYPAEKLKNGEYRFYFLTHCRDMYIDINAENRVIFVRDTSFSSSDQEHELAHYIKGPRYLPSLYIKDGPVYIQ